MELIGGMIRQDGTLRTDAAQAESAFERAFFEYYGRIVGVLFRMLGDRERAEELAADTFLKLYAQRVSPQEFENLGGWLYRTATRLGVDALRSAARRRRYEQLAAEGWPTPPTPLEDALREETRREVRKALARLKPAQAQLLALRSHGLSYKELAAALDLKAQSVGRLLMRAEEAFEKAYRHVTASSHRAG